LAKITTMRSNFLQPFDRTKLNLYPVVVRDSCVFNDATITSALLSGIIIFGKIILFT